MEIHDAVAQTICDSVCVCKKPEGVHVEAIRKTFTEIHIFGPVLDSLIQKAIDTGRIERRGDYLRSTGKILR